MPRFPAAAFALLLLIPRSGRAAVNACSAPDTAALQSFWGRLTGDNALVALSALAEDSDISEPCRKSSLLSLLGQLKGREKLGLCPVALCPDFSNEIDAAQKALKAHGPPLCKRTCDQDEPSCACAKINPPYEEVLADADAAIAKSVDRAAGEIERKFAAGTVPNCLWTTACPGPSCHASLIRSWWSEVSDQQYSHGTEIWLPSGGFLHLLLGSAFTCSAGKQVGPTCAIYAGTSLLSHYCATPAVNPAAANECTAVGPGTPPAYRCVSQGEVLARMDEIAAWRPEVCGTDPATGEGKCVPAPKVLLQDNRKAIENMFLQFHCSSPDQALVPFCDGLSQAMAMLDKRQADKAVQNLKKIPGGTAAAGVSQDFQGQTMMYQDLPEGIAAPIMAMRAAYLSFGFEAAYYKPDADGWAKTAQAVLSGRPVQCHVNILDWHGYGKDPEGGGHSVVLEGVWTDAKGKDRVLLRDSNYPEVVKAFDVDFIHKTFYQRQGGGVVVCPPSDVDWCRMTGQTPKVLPTYQDRP